MLSMCSEKYKTLNPTLVETQADVEAGDVPSGVHDGVAKR